MCPKTGDGEVGYLLLVNHAPRGLFRAPAWEEMGAKGSVCTAATVTWGLRKGDDIVLTQREMRVSSSFDSLRTSAAPFVRDRGTLCATIREPVSFRALPKSDFSSCFSLPWKRSPDRPLCKS